MSIPMINPMMAQTVAPLNDSMQAQTASNLVKANPLSASSGEFYLDTHQLNKIKANKDSDQGLMQAAEQFEALFVQQMLTRMRRATEALGTEDNPLSRNKESMFQDMLDNQYAVNMTKTTSFGLAERLYEQLSSNVSQAMSTSQIAAANQISSTKETDSTKETESTKHSINSIKGENA